MDFGSNFNALSNLLWRTHLGLPDIRKEPYLPNIPLFRAYEVLRSGALGELCPFSRFPDA
jgi:hypothetical protein